MLQNTRIVPMLILAATALAPAARAEKTISRSLLYDKMRGMWLGQLIGNNAGRATEGQYSGSLPNPASSVPWVLKQVWDGDDDTDMEYLALHILEATALDPNNAELAQQWMDHVTASGIYIANKQAWCLLANGLIPPDTGSRRYNRHWYAIDSQITTESIGALCPALSQAAVDLTARFAHITNEGYPVHAAQFYAALYANAFFESDILTLIVSALDAVPASSRTRAVITDCIEWYIQDFEDFDLNWRATRAKLYDKYVGANSFGRYYNWIESTVNTGATVLALLYGNGNFKLTVQIAVLAGWDCDCNPATAGGLIGIITGYSGLPSDLTDPAVTGDVYKNVYRPGLPDPGQPVPQYDTITNIAARMTALAEQSILNHAGYADGPQEDPVWHIPDQGPLFADPDLPDPNGPTGLVSAAMAAGITVTPTAAVAQYVQTQDRRNLHRIMDGVTTDAFNGVRPYYSYVSDPSQRPDQDFYQLSFSRPVKFTSVTFYEGDVVWSLINTCNAADTLKGGFFTDLSVEVLRDGRFITPADVNASEPLDRLTMYQSITFEFAPTVGEAVRVIGTPGGSEAFTTILELEAAGQVDTGLYIASVRLNDNQPQRSQIGTVEIVFNRDVNISRADVELSGLLNTGSIEITESMFDYNPAARTATLTFANGLPDDLYALGLICEHITDPNQTPLLDDDTIAWDGYYTIRFHRLFGDADGSGRVDLNDMAILSRRWLAEPAETGLDANKDGTLDMSDYVRLLENYDQPLAP